MASNTIVVATEFLQAALYTQPTGPLESRKTSFHHLGSAALAQPLWTF